MNSHNSGFVYDELTCIWYESFCHIHRIQTALCLGGCSCVAGNFQMMQTHDCRFHILAFRYQGGCVWYASLRCILSDILLNSWERCSKIALSDTIDGSLLL